MNTKTRLALGGLLLLTAAAPSYAQGVFSTPPAPNSSQSMPQPPDSAPIGARTLPPGSTGQQRMGTIGTVGTASQPTAPAMPGTATSR